MEINTLNRSQQKRMQIIQAATVLFIEQGFAATSMDKIAKQAGVSKQTVYSHFNDKENLFIETITAYCEASDFNEELFHADETLEQNLLRVARSFIGLILSEGANKAYSTCVAHKEEYPELGKRFYEVGPLQVCAQVEACIECIRERKLLNIPDSRFATIQLLGMVQGDWKMRHALGQAKPGDMPSDAYILDCINRFIKAYS